MSKSEKIVDFLMKNYGQAWRCASIAEAIGLSVKDVTDLAWRLAHKRDDSNVYQVGRGRYSFIFKV